MDDGSAPDEAPGSAEEMRPDALPLRILMAGEGYWSWYQGACGEALRSLGHIVRDFSWFRYFSRRPDERAEAVPISLSARVQNRLKWGPRMSSLNRALVEEAVAFRPDVLFVYNGTHVFRDTLVEIKARCPGIFLVQYCNDNPFGGGASRLLWRHLIRAIPFYDLHFVYRHQNVGDFRRAGAGAVELLRSYYIPEANRRVTLSPQDSRFVCDVVFAGHYEDDGRVEYLEAICRAGHKLNLFGGGWGDALRRLDPSSPLRALYPIRPAVGEDYLKALCGARIALCFLSRLNRDTYTRRNFEIPATGTFMLSEYTEDLASLFEEGREAEFFRSRDEMLDKIAYYLRRDDEREAVARRGRERLIRGGHDVTSRMRQAVLCIQARRDRASEREIA